MPRSGSSRRRMTTVGARRRRRAPHRPSTSANRASPWSERVPSPDADRAADHRRGRQARSSPTTRRARRDSVGSYRPRDVDLGVDDRRRRRRRTPPSRRGHLDVRPRDQLGREPEPQPPRRYGAISISAVTYWLDTSPGMTTHRRPRGGPDRDREVTPPLARLESARAPRARRAAAPSAAPQRWVAVDRVRAGAERGERGDEPRRRAGEAGVQSIGPGASRRPSRRVATGRRRPSRRRRSRARRGSRASPRCRRRGHSDDSLVPSASAAHTSARLAIALRARAPARRRSTGPSPRRTRRRRPCVHDSGVHGGLKPRAISPPRNTSLDACVDEHDRDTPVALGDVDDLEVGDVDAELGGQGEHLGRGPARSGIGIRTSATPRGGDAAGQVGPGVAARLQAARARRGRRRRRRSRISASRSISRRARRRSPPGSRRRCRARSSGWPLAIRVMSRKPPAASRSSAACSSARSAPAASASPRSRCGTWLTTATTWSCARA